MDLRLMISMKIQFVSGTKDRYADGGARVKVLMIKKKNFKTLTMEGALEPVLMKRPLKALEVAVGMKDKRGDI